MENKLAGGIGILGGTFDPIHLGHIDVARAVIEQYMLSRIYIIPAYKNPLRLHQRIVAEADDRFVMAHLATLEYPDLIVSGVEIERGREYPEPSYTIDTLERYRARYPDTPLILIVGADNVAFHKWYRIDEYPGILSRIIIVSRPEYEAGMKANISELETKTPAVAELVEYLPDVENPVSSTTIRELLDTGTIPPGSLHPQVEHYIRKYGLYGLKR